MKSLIEFQNNSMQPLAQSRVLGGDPIPTCLGGVADTLYDNDGDGVISQGDTFCVNEDPNC